MNELRRKHREALIKGDAKKAEHIRHKIRQATIKLLNNGAKLSDII